MTIVQSLANLGALAIGPWSYTAVINSFSTVITAFSGYLFWDESISKTKIIGIVLMVICLSLATAKDKDKKRASLKWLLFALVASLACASIMTNLLTEYLNGKHIHSNRYVIRRKLHVSKIPVF